MELIFHNLRAGIIINSIRKLPETTEYRRCMNRGQGRQDYVFVPPFFFGIQIKEKICLLSMEANKYCPVQQGYVVSNFLFV